MLRLIVAVFLMTCLLNPAPLLAQEGTNSEKKAVPPPPKPGIIEETPAPAKPAPVVTNPIVQPLPISPTPEASGQPVKVSYLVSNADEFSAIYERLVTAKGYPRAAGHVIAAAKMVNCLFKNTAEEKADFLDQVIQNLGAGTEDNVRRRLVVLETNLVLDIRNSSQAAQLAAILACKMGDRKFDNLISDFDAAILELATKMTRATGVRAGFPFFQLLSVAELMN